MIVTITANPSIDRTYQVAQLTFGALHRARRTWQEASGKGVNVTRLLHQLETPTEAIVTLGGGDAAVFGDLAADIPVRVVPVRGAVRTNITLLTGTHEPTKINDTATSLASDEIDSLLDAAARAIAIGASWLVLSGSLPGDTDPAMVTRLVELSHRHHIPMAVDTTGPGLVAAVDAGADLLAPNADELSELTNIVVDTPTAAIAAGQQLRRRGIGELLISMGGQGAVLLSGQGCWHGSPPAIQPVNTTGAGDALLAGFLAYPRATPPQRLATAISIGSSICLMADTARLGDTRVDSADVDIASLRTDPLPEDPH